MVKCYFCYKNDTPSYWQYYCESCMKVKQFCKLIGSEKLCKSLQFKIKDSELQAAQEHGETSDTEKKTPLEESPTPPISDPEKPRRSLRSGLKNLSCPDKN